MVDLGKVVQVVESAVSAVQGQPQQQAPAPDAGVGMRKVMSQPVTVSTTPDVSLADDESSPVEVKRSWLWITDDHGKGNVPVTLLFVAFWASTIAYVVSLFERIGPFTMRPFDAAACGVYLGSIIALYLGHRGVEAYGSKK